MIVCTGSWTFPTAVISFSRTKHMQHLRILFWFLLPYRISSYKYQVSNRSCIISRSNQNKRRPVIIASPHIQLLLETWPQFSLLSDETVNKAKSEIARIGALKGVSMVLFGMDCIHLTRTIIKVSGILVLIIKN